MTIRYFAILCQLKTDCKWRFYSSDSPSRAQDIASRRHDVHELLQTVEINEMQYNRGMAVSEQHIRAPHITPPLWCRKNNAERKKDRINASVK